jgi:hypothetical protein
MEEVSKLTTDGVSSERKIADRGGGSDRGKDNRESRDRRGRR